MVNRYCEFHTDDDLRATISIGDNTRIGFGVKFICVTHDTGDHNRRAGKLTYKPIKVGDGCWIGAESIILPGVTISNGVVIGAGSVVTKNCECDGLYAGNPARRIKSLE